MENNKKDTVKIVNSEVKEIAVDVATGEVSEDNLKVEQFFECVVSHMRGSSQNDSYYRFVFKLYTKDDFELPITFQLLADEVANVNLSSDNILKKIPVNTSRKFNLKGCFYLGKNEDDSVYIMALINLPGDVYKAVRFNRNQNSFVSKCFKMNKELYLTSIALEDGNRVSKKNVLQFSKSKTKSIDDLYNEFIE